MVAYNLQRMGEAKANPKEAVKSWHFGSSFVTKVDRMPLVLISNLFTNKIQLD